MPAYDPKKVPFSWGTIVATQYGKDNLVKVAYNEDQFTYQPSATGRGARSLNGNRSGRFTVTLLATSPTNDLFMAQALADLASGAGSQPALCKDLQGLAYAHGDSAWCVKIPDLERAKEVGEVEWVFEVDELQISQAGAQGGSV